MTKRQMFAIFFAAVILRIAYVALVGILGGDFANGSDSGKFLKRAMNLLEYGQIIFVDDGVVISDTERMPIYPYFLAGILGLFGENRLWLVGISQAFIDASSVIAIGLIAAAIDKRWALPSAILGCGWITLIVYSSYVLSDTLFLSFFCWGLCASVWATKMQNPLFLLCIAGLAFSCALLTRPVLLFFPCVIFLILSYLLSTIGKKNWRKAITFSAIPPLFMMLAILPRAININYEFGKPAVITQTGNHALDVVDQFLRLCPDCVASNTEQQMHKQVQIRLAEKSEADQGNPVILDQVRRSVAFEFLQQVPTVSLILGTTNAVLRSALQTGVYEMGHQLKQSPSYFSSITGGNFRWKVKSFLGVAKQDVFLIIWVLAQLIALLVCILQLLGTASCLWKDVNRPYVIMLLAVAGYFLAMNGPFGNPRYGMPLTPVFIILTASGLITLKEYYSRLSRKKTGLPKGTTRQ